MVTTQLVLFSISWMVLHQPTLCHAEATSHQQATSRCASNHEASINQQSIHEEKVLSTHAPTKKHHSTIHSRPLDTNYDLSRVKYLSPSDLEADFNSIVLTMRWKGRQVLDYFNSDLLQLIFSNPHGEPEKVVQERWEAQCDFLLNHRDLDHFQSYILNGEDQFIDMAGLTTKFMDL